MLNLSEEFKNNMALYCLARRILNGEAANGREAWLNGRCIFRLTPGAVQENRGIGRSLAAIAWGYWYGAKAPGNLPEDIPRPEDIAALPVKEREQKVLFIMEDWFETLQEAFTKAFMEEKSTKKELEKRYSQIEVQRRQMRDLRIGYNRENYSSILREAVSFAGRMSSSGCILSEYDPESIQLPLQVLREWLLNEGNARTAPLRLLLYLYYHYAPKDDEGFVLMYATDFGLWASDTAKFYEVYRAQIMKKEGKLTVPAEEIKLGLQNSASSNSLPKMRISIPAFVWDEDSKEQEDKVIKLRDNGERGLVRALTCLYLLPKCRMNKGIFPGYKADAKVFENRFKVIGEAYAGMPPSEKEKCDEELLLWAEVALNPFNWDHTMGKVTAPQMRLLPPGSEKREHVNAAGQHILYITEEQARRLAYLQKQ